MMEDVNKIANDKVKGTPMAPDINHIKCQAGYPGHDSMRERAKRYFAGEYTRLEEGMDRPPSFSAKSRTPLRKY